MVKRKQGVCDVEGCSGQIYSKKKCQFHYWRQNAKDNAEKKKNNGKTAAKQKTAKDLNLFFASQLLEVPDNCENCGCSLSYLKNSRMRKSIIAHILPKREMGGFPSVATHPQNRLFLCLDCHKNMDEKGKEFVLKMNCFPLLIERLNEFVHLVTERRRLPNDFDKFVENVTYNEKRNMEKD